MFVSFLDELRRAGIPASPKEHLTLLEALDRQVIGLDVEEFYYLARVVYVKDEGLIDRFDQVFAKVFRGVLGEGGRENAAIPEEWLKAIAEKYLTPEEMEKIKSLGSWEEIMETLNKRLEEQQGRHQGGNKWIGTGGTSPYGNGGYNPEGVRIGGDQPPQARDQGVGEARVPQSRQCRRARHAQHQAGAAPPAPLRARGCGRRARSRRHHLGTARKGYLDVTMRPERRNAVKLLLFLDVGGSMDPHVKLCEELFSAATAEFKHLEFFYFHNCIYEGVWKDNRRRFSERTPTWDVLHKFGHDYKLVFVGDAQMSPYEISHPGGSVEHNNPEAGAVWLQRMTGVYPSAAWLNPVPEAHWDYSQSTTMIRELMADRMYPLTLEGLDEAARALSRKR